MSLLDHLEGRSTRTPQAPFVIDQKRVLTYGDAFSATARVAYALCEAGVRPGDRVILALPNSIEFCLLLYGIFHAGATAVLVNPRWTPFEVEGVTTLTRPKLGIGPFSDFQSPENFLSGSERPLERRSNPSGIALMLLTSGTTGKPKAVMLSQDALEANALQLAKRKQLTEKDRFLCSIPLFHSNGQVAALQSMLVAGSSLVLLDRFTPQGLVESVIRHGITAISGVPTLYQQLVNYHQRSPVDLSSLRLCISGSAPLAPSLFAEVEERFGAFILEGYGLTECSAGATGNPIEGRKVGTVGVALEGTEIQVVDSQNNPLPYGQVGEVMIKGPQLMMGYFEDPDATSAAFHDGWLRSGDLGHLDPAGYLTLCSRKKELIIRGGFNVYPAEVESALRETEGVQDIAVVGLPDGVYGESVHCAVISNLTPMELARRIQAISTLKLARYKRPISFSIHEDFPRTSVAKVQRAKLREIIVKESELHQLDQSRGGADSYSEHRPQLDR